MAEPKVFEGGVPTEPDVMALMKAFPVPSLTPGRLIGYDEAAAIFREHRESSRFKTVTNAWRKRLERNHGIVLEAEANQGFRVLDDSGKLRSSIAKVRQGVRATKRGYIRSAHVDRSKLEPGELKQLDHLQMKAGAALAAVQLKSAKSIPEVL